MSNRMTNVVEAINHKIHLIAGNFDTNGASNPASPIGSGFTVVHSATGKYTVTLLDAYFEVEAFVASISGPGGTDTAVQTDPSAAVSGKVIQIYTTVGGTNTDIAASATSRIHFIAMLRNSVAR